MHCRISLRRTLIPGGFTMLISSRYHRLLSNDVKRKSKLEGMGLYNMNSLTYFRDFLLYSNLSLYFILTGYFREIRRPDDNLLMVYAAEVASTPAARMPTYITYLYYITIIIILI